MSFLHGTYVLKHTINIAYIYIYIYIYVCIIMYNIGGVDLFGGGGLDHKATIPPTMTATPILVWLCI